MTRPSLTEHLPMTEPHPRIGIVNLGCPKALERILTQLRAEGYEIAPSYEDADLVVVNTVGLSTRLSMSRSAPSMRPWRRTGA